MEKIEISYFDTIPVASSLCVLRSCYLFAASEFVFILLKGNHGFYSFAGLAEDEPVMQTSNMMMGDPV